MRWFLFLLSVVSFLAGVLLLPVSLIPASILILASAVLLTGAALVEAITAARKSTPAPQPPATGTGYFYSTAGTADGPHTLATMRRLLKIGAITATTPVTQTGLPDWHQAADFPELSLGE